MKTLSAATVLLLLLAAGLPMDRDAADGSDPGKQLFDQYCATCHSVDPPPLKAPPMRMVVRHYMMADTDDPWAAIRAWVPAPDTSRSLLPAHAVEKFGLMAPLDLPEEDLEAVITYLKTLASDSTGMGMGMTGQGRMVQSSEPCMMGQGGMSQPGMMGRSGQPGMMGRSGQPGMMQRQGMTAPDSTMVCPRMGTVQPADCPRMGTAAGTPCPRMRNR